MINNNGSWWNNWGKDWSEHMVGTMSSGVMDGAPGVASLGGQAITAADGAYAGMLGASLVFGIRKRYEEGIYGDVGRMAERSSMDFTRDEVRKKGNILGLFNHLWESYIK